VFEGSRIEASGAPVYQANAAILEEKDVTRCDIEMTKHEVLGLKV